MRALSWKQPYAQLMLHGKIETRKWATNYRGDVLICASQKAFSRDELIKIAGDKQLGRMDQMFRVNDILGYGLSRGFAIAVGTLVDCRKMTEEDEDRCFVQYNPELYCHIYENVREIRLMPFKGRQGWSTLTSDVIDLIQFV